MTPRLQNAFTHIFGCAYHGQTATGATGATAGPGGAESQRGLRSRGPVWPDFTASVGPLVPFLDPEYIFVYLTNVDTADQTPYLLERPRSRSGSMVK